MTCRWVLPVPAGSSRLERASITPDIVTLSKSIGGYGMPFALTLLRPELDQWKPGEHNGTFRGYQLSLVAAKAGLEFMLNEHVEDAVRERAPFVEKFLKENIETIDSRITTRGIGLLWGVDFGAFEGDVAKAVIHKAFENGLIVERVGRRDSVVKIMPELKVRWIRWKRASIFWRSPFVRLLAG